MEVNDYRISKLRLYLFDIINTLTTNRNYQITANMLSNEIDDYSLDKIPTNVEVENWIIGGGVNRDVYSFRSRKPYSQDTINNLKNIGFFEEFEKIIKSNNDKGVLPEIDDIESIECLNCGTMISNDDGKTGTFDIQIQITYRENL
jgi:hypothetical protein